MRKTKNKKNRDAQTTSPWSLSYGARGESTVETFVNEVGFEPEVKERGSSGGGESSESAEAEDVVAAEKGKSERQAERLE